MAFICSWLTNGFSGHNQGSFSFTDIICMPVGHDQIQWKAQIACVWSNKLKWPYFAERHNVFPKGKILKQHYWAVIFSRLSVLNEFSTYGTFNLQLVLLLYPHHELRHFCIWWEISFCVINQRHTMNLVLYKHYFESCI